jgi:2-iminoacetate synthase ThiH
MKVKVGDKIYDSEKEMVLLIFENDEDRIHHAKNLTMMQEKPEGIRKYLIAPEAFSISTMEDFMKI